MSDNFGLESGSTNDTMGWSIVGNGENPAWIDTNGLYSVDQLFAGRNMTLRAIMLPLVHVVIHVPMEVGLRK